MIFELYNIFIRIFLSHSHNPIKNLKLNKFIPIHKYFTNIHIYPDIFKDIPNGVTPQFHPFIKKD